MQTALDALPGRPLSAEDVATLNNAASIRVLPYTWFGEQVIAALLLHDPRADEETDGDSEADGTDGEVEESPAEENPFGGRDETIGTVEVIGDEGPGTEASSPGPERVDAANDADQDEDLSVFAVGYDDEEGTWVVIGEIDPDAEFTDAEEPIRAWASVVYHEAIIDRLAIGPSEYDLDHGRGG